MQQARRDLTWARRRAEGEDPDYSGAANDRWEAALHALLAVLRIAGHRLTGREGHHEVAIEVGQEILGEGWRADMRDLRRLSRSRNDALYELLTTGSGDLEYSLDVVEKLVSHVERSVERARRMRGIT